jgi:hypothetical protein
MKLSSDHRAAVAARAGRLAVAAVVLAVVATPKLAAGAAAKPSLARAVGQLVIATARCRHRAC